MEKGILVVALGHPNFAKMAFNLAMSIKANDPCVKVALAHNYSNLGFIDGPYRAFIDYDFELPKTFYIDKGKNAFGMMKTLLYEFTPFENTLYIDVDSLMIKDKSPARFFEENERHGFVISHFDKINPSTDNHDFHEHWVKFGKVKNLFTFKDCQIMGSCQSSVIGFKKSELTASLFASAYHVYRTLAERNIAENMWFNTVPDELCFWLAHGIVGHTPTYNLDPYVLFSYQLRGVTNYTRVYTDRYFVTFPSAMSLLKSYEKDFYNLLIRYYSDKVKKPPLHFWVDKRAAAPATIPVLRQKVHERFVR